LGDRYRAITLSALFALDATDPARRSLVHATKAAVGKRFFVGAQAIQLRAESA